MIVLKILLCQIASLLAPFIVLVPQFRRGWFLTPDDTKSPYGQYEVSMQKKLAKWGPYWSDWWWLGVRNSAYGLAYALKPKFFKELDSYNELEPTVKYKTGPSFSLPWTARRFFAELRVIEIDGYKEWCLSAFLFHVIFGYRLRPIYDQWYENRWRVPEHRFEYRKVNMDARPIFSIRFGATDD